MNTPLRIIYAGTPGFAVPALDRLIESNHELIAVYTQPDRPAGRGRRLTSSPVKLTALAAGLPVIQPDNFKSRDSIRKLENFSPDLMVVAAYGLILPGRVLPIPRFGCWNIHASLLPRWRGAAPVQRAIIAGDRQTGISIMQMDAGLDTGPVIDTLSTLIEPGDTGGSLHDRLAELGADALLTNLNRLAGGEPLKAAPQEDSEASYAPKLSKSEAQVDWQQEAAHIERLIRAFDPWPVAWCELNDERLRLWKATVERQNHRQKPGTVLSIRRRGLTVACGQDVLCITELQRPGGRRISAADYYNSLAADRP